MAREVTSVAEPGGGEGTAKNHWAVGEDRHLRISVGFWQLTAISLSGVIVSGWLLAELYAAKAAGPTGTTSASACG
jgi:hypothetical protein